MNSIKYYFSYQEPQKQFLDIKVVFVATDEVHEIQLPAWRPGRYELGNFAKNVRSFKVFLEGNEQPVIKISKDRWRIQTKKAMEYTISYQYFSADLNAGSTFLSPDQLYVNPVNCCVFIDGMQDLSCLVELDLPSDYTIACQLDKVSKNTLLAKDFDQLADSPFISSNNLKHDSYTVDNVVFNLWFQGECKPDFQKIKSDFSKFTQQQYSRFGEFPFKEYHFLFQIDTKQAHHGVEHQGSTVIYLGPSTDTFTSSYSDFLGISSHELYHSWNVKAIRPIEMFPYDFTKENYSKLGYLCEGVTTYMGDLMLLRSGVFTIEQYLLELDKLLQKHFDNLARHYTSVADSGFDTWLDGYVPGIPGRKVSIYTEGALLSFVLDVSILHITNGEHRLDDVMKQLYWDFAKNGRGVSEKDFWSTIQYFVGDNLDSIWQDYYHGSADFEVIINETFKKLGFLLKKKKNSSISETSLGIRTINGDHGAIIKSYAKESLAMKSGLMIDDEIIAVNDVFITEDFDKWISYFKKDTMNLTVIRKGKLLSIKMDPSNDDNLLIYNTKIDLKSPEQQLTYNNWIK